MTDITITDAARAALRQLIEAAHATTAYLTVDAAGCGGSAYVVQTGARTLSTGDQLYPIAYTGSEDGLTLSAALIVPAAAADLLAGLEMDHADGAFAFANPQAAATCNCGQSFSLTGPVASCTPKAAR